MRGASAKDVSGRMGIKALLSNMDEHGAVRASG
jgi:hypothetical protein